MRHLLLAAVALLAIAFPAAAKGPFDGKWISDLKTQDASGLQDDYLVADGAYACRSCDPPRRYPADGKLRPITGDPEVASESVTVLSPRAILTREISPVRIREVTMTVAPDNKTATYVAIDKRTDVPGRLRTEYVAERVAPAPAGANLVSGKWRGLRYVSVPMSFRLKEFRQDGDRLTVSSPRGGAYSAVLDGPYAPLNASGALQVAFKRASPRSISETMKTGDKIVQVRTYTLSQDGRSLEIVTTDATTGVSFRSTSFRP
jgi:hypothetical protein